MLQRQLPPLPGEFYQHRWRIFQVRTHWLQARAKSVPPCFQPAGHRVRRACAQVSPDPLYGWAFALGDQLVGGGMDVSFGDAAGHAKSPVLAPYSADNVLTISDDYR
ncbi:hypothetical protein G6F23_015427 [Rhizopus arrhizus]|nr:hypothetical protein G6F23_015427 [Rhizopus arrhizus]